MKKIILALMAFIGVITLGFGVTNASAEEIDVDSGKQYTDRGYLLISPATLKYGLLEPGSNYTETIRAYNVGGKSLTFDLTSEAFWVQDGTYDAVFSEPSNRTKLSEWITFPDGTEYTIEPNENVEIRIRVKVPKDAIGGGQYAAVMANIKPNNESGEASVQAQARIALQVYSTINGEITYKGALKAQSIAGFSFEPIIKTSSTIENTGNADFEAKYHLTIKSVFGGDIAHEDTQEKIVLPETTRIFEQSWGGAPALGIFNVSQEITYVNENGEQVVETYEKVTIICPLWLIVIVAAFIVLAIVYAVVSSKKRKAGKNSKKASWEQK